MSEPLHIPDATLYLQQVIDSACKEKAPSGVSINLEKGDYALSEIRIPKGSSVTLYSKDRVRLLYVGMRNRPLFVLSENSSLALREKLEIFYNTNNIREVMRLMIRTSSQNSAEVDISKGVKFSLFSQKVQ